MTPLLLTLALAAPPQPFTITVVDEQTGRGVPLIELRTTNHLRYFTDNAGVIAFEEPTLMDMEVFFHVSGHGYEYPKDGFGYRGVRLTPKTGGQATVKVKRVNIAERLYRITGDGLYAESVKANLDVPFPTSGKNAKVLGCDSVFMAVYRNELFWIWGDTNRAAYPLGNFHMTAATTPLPGKNGIDPEKGFQFEYLSDGKGFVKGAAPIPGQGPTWVESLVVLPDKNGKERLWGEYVKVDQKMTPLARGFAVYDDAKKEFVKHADIPLDAPILPTGHTFRHKDGDTEYLYFGNPFPLVRVPATEAAFTDLSKYEAYTCLKPGRTLVQPEMDRDEGGKVRYTWRKNTPPVDPEAQAKLMTKGLLKPDDSWHQTRDRDTGAVIRMHRGSVNWNAYRKKWVMIANQVFGQPSNLGEVWYAEADSPIGPWRDAVKVVTHDRMDFYNPCHHAEFDRDGGKTIYFEGTYTNTFSGNPDRTPRYEYNQVMYKLDLSDERLQAKSKK
jgi:hypothetical protein